MADGKGEPRTLDYRPAPPPAPAAERLRRRQAWEVAVVEVVIGAGVIVASALIVVGADGLLGGLDAKGAGACIAAGPLTLGVLIVRSGAVKFRAARCRDVDGTPPGPTVTRRRAVTEARRIG